MCGVGTPCRSARSRTAASAAMGFSSISLVGRMVAARRSGVPSSSASNSTLRRRAPAEEATRFDTTTGRSKRVAQEAAQALVELVGGCRAVAHAPSHPSWPGLAMARSSRPTATSASHAARSKSGSAPARSVATSSVLSVERVAVVAEQLGQQRSLAALGLRGRGAARARGSGRGWRPPGPCAGGRAAAPGAAPGPAGRRWWRAARLPSVGTATPCPPARFSAPRRSGEAPLPAARARLRSPPLGEAGQREAITPARAPGT